MAPAPAVGGSLFYRWYVRWVGPDNGPNETLHGIQNGANDGPGSRLWYFNQFVNASAPGSPALADSDWNMHWQNPVSTDRYRAQPDLSKGVTYRIELEYRVMTSTTAEFHTRVFTRSDAGVETLVRDDDDFFDNNGSGPITLGDNPVQTMPSTAGLVALMAGVNGWDNAPGGPMMLQGAFAICVETWCGEYQPGEGVSR